RRVVDDEDDVSLRIEDGCERAHHRLQVFAFVVRRHADHCARALARDDRGRCHMSEGFAREPRVPPRRVHIIAAMAKSLPRNADVAEQLALLADLSEILGEDSFRVIAYRRAATRIRETPAPVAELALEGKAKELPGVGRTIEGKVVEIINGGEIEALTRRRQRVPAGGGGGLRLPGGGAETGGAPLAGRGGAGRGRR